MAMSGVTVAKECDAAFRAIQLGKPQKLRYIFFNIKDGKEIVPMKEGVKKDNSYEDFVKALPKDKPCYALVDVEVTSKSGADHSKLCYVFWCPENIGVKEKMLYAASKDALKKTCKGTQCELQAHDTDDLKLADVQAKLGK